MLYQENNSVGQNFFECIRYLDFQYLPHMHKHPGTDSCAGRNGDSGIGRKKRGN